MKKIVIIILLVLCLTLLLLASCVSNTVKPESVTIYPQRWATGTGTAENPWANDCIKKALDFVPAGGTIFLKAGYYTLSAALSIEKQVNIIGEGRDKTIIKTANADGFYIETDYVTVKNLTIDGAAQSDGVEELCPIEINVCDYALLENIETKNAGWSGIVSYGVNNATFKNIYTHDNYAIGFHPGTATVGRNKNNTYQNISVWDNGQSGFDEAGNKGDLSQESNNVYDNLQCWDNGEQGIVIAFQKDSILSNSFASGNGEEGIYLYDLEDFDVHDCSTTLNGLEGMWLYNLKNVHFTNVISKNNNVSDTDYICGIIISGVTGIVFTSCQSYDDRDTPLQAYGIDLTGANTNISLVNCKLTPNKEGEIYDPAGVVITVITEKRGVSPSVIVRE